MSGTLGKTIDGYEIKIASERWEIQAAQKLRFSVFIENSAARANWHALSSGLDRDKFDRDCDHLIVIDRNPRSGPKVVGTYRLLRETVARRRRGFYSEAEYDLAALKMFPGNILELGRSCIHPDYRKRAIISLLWRGIADYVQRHGIDLMFGCASFSGRDVSPFSSALSLLHHRHRAPALWRPVASRGRYIPMDIVPEDEIEIRQARREMPPLIKGYLRAGGMVGDGAVIDNDFNTIDICLLLPTQAITEKYRRHYLGEREPARGMAV